MAEMTARSSSSTPRSLSGSGIPSSIRDQALDIGTAGSKLLLKMLVAAVKMIDAVHHGLALGGQTRQDQRHRGAQVSGHDRRGGQFGHAAYHGGGAVDIDVGAHPAQL